MEPRRFLAQAGRCAQRRCLTLLGYNSDVGSPTSSAADAFRTTLDLFDTGLDLMRQNLRRSHPESSDAKSSGCFATGSWIARERSLVTVQDDPLT